MRLPWHTPLQSSGGPPMHARACTHTLTHLCSFPPLTRCLSPALPAGPRCHKSSSSDPPGGFFDLALEGPTLFWKPEGDPPSPH